MSDDKQNIDNELAMAILNGLSGPNACKSADERHNKNEIEALKAENARLKAEVERLEKQVNNLITSLQKSHDEHGKALYKLKYKK